MSQRYHVICSTGGLTVVLPVMAADALAAVQTVDRHTGYLYQSLSAVPAPLPCHAREVLRDWE